MHLWVFDAVAIYAELADGNMTNRLLIFSGYNQRAVISLCRECVRLKASFIIIALDKQDTIFLTDYVDYVFCTRGFRELDFSLFSNIFKRVVKAFPDDHLVIAPTAESLNRLLLENRAELQNFGITLPLVEKSLYEQISDKESFYRICEDYGLAVPKVYSSLDDCPKKFVAKNKRLRSSDLTTYLCPVLVRDEEEKQQFIAKFNSTDFYYEEFLDALKGGSHYLLFYFSRNGDVIKFSQENLLQQANGKSIILAQSSDLHLNSISDKYVTLFRKLHFFGLAMVELRCVDNTYYMIEANPRMWGPMQLCVDAGIGILHAFFLDWGLTSIPFRSSIGKAEYCWFGGLRSDILSGKEPSVLSSEKFSIHELLAFLKKDVYCRPDTEQIYLLEQSL